MELHRNSKESKKYAHIIMALRKSRIRREIIAYLSKIYPGTSYPAEIAEKIKASPSNVLYALHGADGRYNSSYSLVSLGLIEMEKAANQRFYKLTFQGLEIAREFFK